MEAINKLEIKIFPSVRVDWVRVVGLRVDWVRVVRVRVVPGTSFPVRDVRVRVVGYEMSGYRFFMLFLNLF